MKRTLIIILILVLLITEDSAKTKKKSKSLTAFDKHLRDKKAEVRVSECAMLDEEFSINCMYFHIDYECFIKHMGVKGLEFGEHSSSKENNFVDCYKNVYNGGQRK